jgi:hypothetical protein
MRLLRSDQPLPASQTTDPARGVVSAEAGYGFRRQAIEPKFRTIPINLTQKTPSESPYPLRHRQIRHLRSDSLDENTNSTKTTKAYPPSSAAFSDTYEWHSACISKHTSVSPARGCDHVACVRTSANQVLHSREPLVKDRCR